MNNTQSKLADLFRSQIGKKIITGITGLALIGFAFSHVSAQLVLLFGELLHPGDGIVAYNEYTHFLESLGSILYVLELGLLSFFVFHAVVGIQIAMGKRRARPEKYAVYKSAGAPGRQSVSSKSMIYTGVIMLVWLVVHILTFKFGPNVAEGFVITYDGVEMRDMARLVIETFQNPIPAIGYTVVMLLLGLHLRHGFWSALHSLGVVSPRLAPMIYSLGLFIAVGLALGFLILPITILLGIIGG